MLLAIDARTATGAFTGIGRYTTALVSALIRTSPDLDLLVIVTRSAAPQLAALAGPRVRLHATAMEIPRHPWSDLWLHWSLPRLLARERAAALLSCANYLPLFSGGAKRIVTIHDLVPFKHPELDPWRFVVYLRAMLRQAAASADAVIAVSEATARELRTVLGVPRDRIAVIHNGVLPLFRQTTDGEVPPVSGPYVLSVGARIPRKNFTRLVRAFAKLAPRIPHALVIAGPPGQSQPELDRTVRELALGSRVHFIGYPTDGELVALYNRASLFVYPSVYEGFGIPVAEAMACGTPVACSNRSSVPEVAGGAAELFDPYDVDAIAAACAKVLDDPEHAARLRAAGLARARAFTWDESARRTAELVRALVHDPRSRSALPEEPGGATRLDAVLAAVARAAAGRAVGEVSVLEVGCGNGNLTAPLAALGYSVTGIDVDATSVDAARRRAEGTTARFAAGDPHRFRPETPPDVIVLSEVLEHLHEPERMLVHLASIAAPNARLVLTVPNGYGPWELMNAAKKLVARLGLGAPLRAVQRALGYRGVSLQSANPHLDHVQFFTERRLAVLAQACGWRVVARHNLSLAAGVFPVSLAWRRWRGLERLDTALASALPARAASGWLWELEREVT